MDEKIQVKRYKVRHSIDKYTFPKEARIHAVSFDEKYMHVELTDQRILSIPLWWIPTIHNASDEDRNKFENNQSRTMIIWDPDKCGINDEISIADYLGPAREVLEQKRPDYSQNEPQKQLAEPKTRK
ncbi:MAG TPA: DUF2442 domain-containing protein [Anaerolineales bacterium]|nr:DUF2442 domain-containing protein [Anaerolineales bacterium]